MSFTRQSVISIALAGGYAVMALLISVLSARLMTLDQYGLYASVMGHVLILTALTSGLPQLLVREITSADHAGADDVLRGLIRWSLGWVALSSVLVAIGAAILRLVFPGQPDWWAVFWPGIGVLAGFGVLNVVGAILRALERPIISQLPGSLVRPVLQIAALTLLAGIATITADIAIRILLGATAIAVLAAGILLKARLKGRPVAPSVYLGRAWNLALVTIGMMIVCQRANQHLGTVLLQYLGSVDKVALYQPAVEALVLTGLPALAVTLILMPRLRRALIDGDTRLQQQLVTRSSRLIFACSVLIAVGLLALGPSGLAAIFGATFSEAYPPLAIIAGGQILASAFGNPEVVLAQAHRERLVASIMGTGVACNLMLSVALIPSHGPVGAAIATAAALLGIRIALALACRRALGIAPDVLGKAPSA